MEFDNKLKPVYKNIGYHRGDLGKSEYAGRMRGQRGTGHFGTGTYFTGKPISQGELDSGSFKDRPEHQVDFSNYNLYKPKTDREGYELHEALKAVNNYLYDEERSTNAIQSLARLLGVDQNQLKEILDQKVKTIDYEFDGKDYERLMDRSLDTGSTLLMKALGYQGIDVRHLPTLDNTGYGSVIYDLLPESIIKK